MLRVTVDLSAVATLIEELDPQRMEATMKGQASTLAAGIHAHINEEAHKRLHSRLKPYLDGLKMSEEDGEWIISLDKAVRWIDDGQKPHEMIADLLNEKQGSKGKVHTSKEGHKWRVIPFMHGPGKGAGTSTPDQMSLVNTLKSEFKRRTIPWGKVEKDDSGQAKTGLLHSFNVMTEPKKTHEGPGQGWGKVGQVKQGATGIPFLQGVRVYQQQHKDAKTGKETTKRSVMTFRIVSTKHMGTGRWYHPGLPAENIFEDAIEWAEKEWDTVMLPKLLDTLVGK